MSDRVESPPHAASSRIVLERASRRARVGSLLVLGATFGFALKGVFARMAYGFGLGGETVLLLRMLIAAPFFGAALLFARTRRSRRKIAARDWRRAAAVGVLFASSGAADFFAIERIGAGPSRVILFAHPALVIAYQSLTAGKAPGRAQMAAFAGAWVGLWLAAGMGPGSEGTHLDPVGVGLALLSALGYAGYLLCSHGLMSTMGSASFACVANLAGMFYVVAIETIGGLLPSTPIPSAAWTPIFGLVIVSTVIPVFAFCEGLHRLGAVRASLLSLVGPPATITAAALWVGETMSVTQLLGCALVVASVSLLRAPQRLGARTQHLPRPCGARRPLTPRAARPQAAHPRGMHRPPRHA